MKRIVSITLYSVLILYTVDGNAGDLRASRKDQEGLSRILTPGHSVVFDGNNISTFIRNNGSFNRNPSTGNSGFEWPRGTGNTAIYASGIWLGGKVNNDVRVAVAEYSYEFDAGPIRPGINPDDPEWRVYKIKTGDNALNNPDYADWPYREGAPFRVTATGDTLPLLIGDMTVWTVFNDNNPALHTNMNTLPLGIELQLTAYAYNLPNALANTIFYYWKLINKSGTQIDSAYVSLWSDVDLGDSGDDFDGCDTTLGLGYTYNAHPIDRVYGGSPPAVGFDFLQGPLVLGVVTDTARFPDGRIFPGKKLLKMTSCVKNYDGSSVPFGTPQNGQEVFNFQQGFDRYGAPILNNNGVPTRFMFPGDPNIPSGPSNWIETGTGGDRHFMMSAGPFTMAQGDTQEIAAASIISQGFDNRNSVATLKLADSIVQRAYYFVTANSPAVDVDVSYPTGTTATLRIVTDATRSRADSLVASLRRLNNSLVVSLPLFDDGTHGDSAALDGLWTNAITILREPQGMSLDLTLRDSLLGPYTWEGIRDFITTIGIVETNNPIVFLDDLNHDGVVNPGEYVRYGFTLANNTPYILNLLVVPDPRVTGSGVTIFNLLPGGSYTMTYNPNDTTSYFDFRVPPVYLESSFVIGITASDESNNRWNSTIRFPVVQLSGTAYGTPIAHVSGSSEWEFNVLVVDPSLAQNHTYEMTIVDSIDISRTTGFTLRDSTAGITLLSNHPLPDATGNNIPYIDGFRILRGNNFGNLGLRQDSSQWVSLDPVWFQGYRFGGDPLAAPYSAAIPADALPNYLGHVDSWFHRHYSPPVEIRFGPGQIQKAYRVRRAGGVGTAYAIQAVDPFVDVPFTVWDMSASTPRQLTVCWRDQSNNSLWDPLVGDDGVEVVFIYFRTYDPVGHQWLYENEGGDPALWSDVCTVGPQADMMYGFAVGVLPGHVLNESPGIVYLRPWFALRNNDRFTFNPTVILGVGEDDLPARFSLGQNYPNPFNPSTTILFSIPKQGTANLRVYNMLGQEVATVVDDVLPAGTHSVRWEGTSNSNRQVATGVYFYRLESGGFVATRKLLLLR